MQIKKKNANKLIFKVFKKIIFLFFIQQLAILIIVTKHLCETIILSNFFLSYLEYD